MTRNQTNATALAAASHTRQLGDGEPPLARVGKRDGVLAHGGQGRPALRRVGGGVVGLQLGADVLVGRVGSAPGEAERGQKADDEGEREAGGEAGARRVDQAVAQAGREGGAAEGRAGHHALRRIGARGGGSLRHREHARGHVGQLGHRALMGVGRLERIAPGRRLGESERRRQRRRRRREDRRRRAHRCGHERRRGRRGRSLRGRNRRRPGARRRLAGPAGQGGRPGSGRRRSHRRGRGLAVGAVDAGQLPAGVGPLVRVERTEAHADVARTIEGGGQPRLVARAERRGRSVADEARVGAERLELADEPLRRREIERCAGAEAPLLEPAHDRRRRHAVSLSERAGQDLHAGRRGVAAALDEDVVAHPAASPLSCCAPVTRPKRVELGRPRRPAKPSSPSG